MGRVEYIYDPSVDDGLDWQLRALLSTCFQDPIFRVRRFNNELPGHRWVIRDEEGVALAHAAVHDKRIGSPGGELHVGAVAEVCVHPLHRGKKYVGELLGRAHEWMRGQGMSFSLLLGLEKVYRELGYHPVRNPMRHYSTGRREWVCEPVAHTLVLPLAEIAWPEGEIDLKGPLF